MAEEYKNFGSNNIEGNEIAIYTVPPNGMAIITGLFVTNKANDANGFASLIVRKENATKYYIGSSNTPLPASTTICYSGVGQRIHLESNESLYITITGENVNADVFGSALQITA